MITLLELRPYTGDMLAPSPNHGVRRAHAIKGIVLHATEDAGHEAGTLTWLRSPVSQASCHLLVSRAGRVTRLVGDRQRAWHAGLAWWRGTSDVNSITLGIEIANRNDGEPFSTAQYRRVADIVAHYCRQGLTLADVVGHAAISAGRKTDPLGWDWDRFRALVRRRLWVTDVPLASSPPARPPAPGAPVAALPVAWRGSGAPLEAVPAFTSAKPLLRSRTLWLNALTVLAAAGALMADALDLMQRIGITLPEQVVMWALFGVGLLNILLRLRTTQPLGGSSTCPPPEAPLDPSPVPLIMTRHARRQPGAEAGATVRQRRGVQAV